RARAGPSGAAAQRGGNGRPAGGAGRRPERARGQPPAHRGGPGARPAVRPAGAVPEPAHAGAAADTARRDSTAPGSKPVAAGAARPRAALRRR
ncbi:MAG TPA: 23S rRNA pseudouridylate synthase B, partial [Alcanivorax sp.]|nr:23S rRNA pseudouridylate synthase B [Alcanivorax sp.]